MVTLGSRDSGRAAAIGCRAHTGWAALVVVAGDVKRPEVLIRGRVELRDPAGRVRPNVHQAARGLERAAAAARIEAAERIAVEQAGAALDETLREAAEEGALVRLCAVVVGASRETRLESILASHALAHAAEGRLYQHALLRGAESRGLDAVAVPKRSIWGQGEAALGVAPDELRTWLDGLSTANRVALGRGPEVGRAHGVDCARTFVLTGPRGVKDGSDGTRTRDLRRDRPAF